MWKVPVDRKRFTMVVIIGRIVAETCCMMKVGIGFRSHCLLGEACRSLAILLIDAGLNYDMTRSKREVEMRWH